MAYPEASVSGSQWPASVRGKVKQASGNFDLIFVDTINDIGNQRKASFVLSFYDRLHFAWVMRDPFFIALEKFN